MTFMSSLYDCFAYLKTFQLWIGLNEFKGNLFGGLVIVLGAKQESLEDIDQEDVFMLVKVGWRLPVDEDLVAVYY